MKKSLSLVFVLLLVGNQALAACPSGTTATLRGCKKTAARSCKAPYTVYLPGPDLCKNPNARYGTANFTHPRSCPSGYEPSGNICVEK